MGVRSGIERAVAELAPGGRLISSRELTGGVSATVYRLDLALVSGERRSVVFRQHGSADFKDRSDQVAEKEHGILAALHRRGLAVPEPYLLSDGGADSAPFLVTEWIEGSTTVEPDDVQDALEQMARFLAALHTIDPHALTLPAIEQIEDPASAAITYLPATESGDRARSALSVSSTLGEAGRSSLLHGDYWPGNVMWHDGRLAAVIDWEDACLGDPLADLAAARVELLCQYGDEAMASFTDHYLAMIRSMVGPLPLTSLPIWEVYSSASALATMGDWGLDPDEEARRRAATERFFERAVREL